MSLDINWNFICKVIASFPVIGNLPNRIKLTYSCFSAKSSGRGNDLSLVLCCMWHEIANDVQQ